MPNDINQPPEKLLDEPIPLVIVQGFLSSAGAFLWGNFENYLNQDLPGGIRRRTIFVRFVESPLPPPRPFMFFTRSVWAPSAHCTIELVKCIMRSWAVQVGFYSSSNERSSKLDVAPSGLRQGALRNSQARSIWQTDWPGTVSRMVYQPTSTFLRSFDGAFDCLVSVCLPALMFLVGRSNHN